MRLTEHINEDIAMGLVRPAVIALVILALAGLTVLLSIEHGKRVTAEAMLQDTDKLQIYIDGKKTETAMQKLNEVTFQ